MTREEAKELLDNLIGMVSDNQDSDYDTALKIGIKALEQEKEPILDKIRAEIEKAVWEDSIYSFDGSDEVRIPRLDPDDVFEIFDKYKEESEDQE